MKISYVEDKEIDMSKEIKGMSDQMKREDKEMEVLEKFLERFNDMEVAREPREKEREICDGQMEARSFYDENGTLQVNPPMEQDHVETTCGRFGGKMTYKLEPIWHQAVVEDQQASKYAVSHFVYAERMHKELSKMRYDKATYGTGIYFTWIVAESVKTVAFKEDAEVDASDALYNNENYNEFTEENYYFTGHNIPIRSFWIDDRAIHKRWHDSKRHEAEDCVIKRTMSLEKFQETYQDNKYFMNIDKVTERADEDPDYGIHNHSLGDEVVLYHYYNAVTKDYWIIANKIEVIYIGKMMNKSGKLPIAVGQHYTNNTSFYGIGVCRKLRYIKAFKAELMQDMLNQSRMGWMSLITGNNGELDGHYFNDPSEINIIQYTQGVEQVKPLQFQPDMNKYQFVLWFLDDLAIQDTGENMKATYQPLAEQLGTVEIIENNRMARVATIDENDDNMLCDILTEVLSSISQFAPTLLKRTEKTAEGEVDKVIYPMIKVPNMQVKELWDGKMVFEEDEWEEWFFEFREKMITSKYYVKVTTGSNVNVMNTLEKNSITQFVQNMLNISQADPSLLQKEDRSGLVKHLKETYWYDEQFSSDTKRDKIRKEQTELMDMINTTLWYNQQPDEEMEWQMEEAAWWVQWASPGGQAQQLSAAGSQTSLTPAQGAPSAAPML